MAYPKCFSYGLKWDPISNCDSDIIIDVSPLDRIFFFHESVQGCIYKTLYFTAEPSVRKIK